MSYRIRAYRPEDRAEVAGLMTRLWSRQQAHNEDYLAWRYERNPYLEPVMAVCESGGRIVAARGAGGMRWRVGGSVLAMPCLGDTVVDKAHEGRALVQRMTRWLLEELAGRGIDWVVNQSPGPLVEKISLRTGWRKVGTWMLANAVNRADGSAPGFERFDANAAPAESGGIRIDAEVASPQDLSDLAARAARGHIGHVRDATYFDWRFQNPFAEYRWLTARSDGLEGYLVLGRNVHGPGRVRVLDLQGSNGEVQAQLLEHALRLGQFLEVRIWWNRFPRRVSGVLVEHEFRAAAEDGGRRSTHLVAATRRAAGGFQAGGVDLLNPANWDPRMIHSDAT